MKFGSKQVPVLLHEDKEDSQAMEDVSMSKQKLCDHAGAASLWAVAPLVNAGEGTAAL